MLRGVPLGSGLRTERLIEWYYEEKQSEIAKTMVMVAASAGADNLDEFIKRYIQSVIPSGKANKEFLELNKAVLDQESSKNYNIKRVFVPGEED